MSSATNGERSRARLSLLVLLVLAAVLTVVVGPAGWAPPAAAHDQLVSSDPAEGARVRAPVREVRLTFGNRLQPVFVAVTLSAGAGPARALATRVEGNTVVALVEEPSPTSSQQWTVTYRIVSSDGHPVSDRVTFTVDPGSGPGAGGAPTPSEPEPSFPAAQPDRGAPEGSALPRGPVIAALSAAVLMAIGGVLVARRHRPGPP